MSGKIDFYNLRSSKINFNYFSTILLSIEATSENILWARGKDFSYELNATDEIDISDKWKKIFIIDDEEYNHGKMKDNDNNAMLSSKFV